MQYCRITCDLLGFDDDIYRAVRRLAHKRHVGPSVQSAKARTKDAKFTE